jgi:hypothetical protein
MLKLKATLPIKRAKIAINAIQLLLGFNLTKAVFTKKQSSTRINYLDHDILP